MINLIEVIETPADLARDLAEMAFRMDEAKILLTRDLHAPVLAVVEAMYCLAELLADDRMIAPRRNAVAECSGGPGWEAI